MEQLLVRAPGASLSVSDPAFGDTGLSQLQVWTTQGAEHLYLFAVEEPGAAADWVKRQKQLGHITSAEFLRTA